MQTTPAGTGPAPQAGCARPARSAVVTDAGDLGTVLAVWAHPDDEAFVAGGLLAAASDAGRRVACVTATLGERGTTDPTRWPPERLGPVRRAELRASLAALGVGEHYLLDIPDGACAAQPSDPVVRRLTEIVQQVRPSTIVTFGPDGLTGHEDHQAVSRWATTARALAAPGAALLYATTTEEHAAAWDQVSRQFPVFLADGLPLRTPATALAVHLSLGPARLDRKLVALRAHATQMTTLIAAVGEDAARRWWSTESFVSAETAAPFPTTWGTWRVAA